MNWDWFWLLASGYLVGSQVTLVLLKYSPKYRAHCKLRLVPKHLLEVGDAKKTKKEP